MPTPAAGTGPRIAVLGTGYLGATHAVCMAELGFTVVGYDVDATKVERLAAGEVPIFEPGLEELLRKNLESGRLSFTTDIDGIAGWADVHFVCVGTPQRAGDGGADLRYVDAAVDQLIAAGLAPGALIVGKSTVPAGTAAGLAARISTAAPDVELAWNPEFLREGFAVEDTLRPDRLVFGVRPGGAAEVRLRAVYAATIEAGTPVVVTDYATAELVKVAANAFLATKISFINAMAEICDVAGADVLELATAIGYDARIGNRFLRPGIGFGGGCLPKDIRAFQARATELGAGSSLAFLAEIDAVNLRARQRAVTLTRAALGGTVAGRRLGVLGAAFKPNSDDIRDSPALDIAAALAAEGARVSVYDPAAVPNARLRYPSLEYAASVREAVTAADAVLVLTEWAEFRSLDPAALLPHVAGAVVVDGRHALDEQRWRDAGWEYHSLGRPSQPASPAGEGELRDDEAAA
ncbi:UDP-glucose/GDP-mannose dehydrogenase family protein [Pseudofrankia sp. DC12]|uniref:UDP-glucose dehydrogenase family protein n=1 Tax=Pseudofrankia sp. DC12 TaxID=683315 RepID=UPI0005F7A5D1|nr:UDP-glucose/GDP-mannose dehydrogenase family protein [Pseudofrankia sp. DC12]